MSCYETKICIKRKARDSQDTLHQIVGDNVVTVSERTAAKLLKLYSLAAVPSDTNNTIAKVQLPKMKNSG